MKRQKCIVSKEHKASFSYALIAVEGDWVDVGREDLDMPGWFWCKNSKGVEMWAPYTYLEIKEAEGIFKQDYNSVELNAKVGDIVQYLGETLGWVECLDNFWRYGWIPKDKLTNIIETPL